MEKRSGRVRRSAKVGASKEGKLPSIDILIRKICRKDRSVGILAR